jgi:hypothetical protein
MSRRQLRPFIDEGLLQVENAGKWRVPDDEPEPVVEAGEFVVFTLFLKRGLSFPTSEFLWGLLSFYRIQIHDLGPNSILQITCFVALCECFFG